MLFAAVTDAPESFPLSIALERYTRFFTKKYNRIKAGIGINPDSYISCRATDFLDLLKETISIQGDPNNTPDPNVTGIKVYFACYHPFGGDGSHIPNGKEKQIGLVFSPTIQDVDSRMGDRAKTTDDFYVLTKTGSSFKAEKKIVGHWVKKYKSTALTGALSDTRCLWYTIDQINALISEVTPKLATTNPDMVFALGAYDNPEKIDDTSISGTTTRIDISHQFTGTFIFGKKTEIIALLSRVEPLISELDKHSEMSLKEKAITLPDDDPDAYDTGIPIPPAGTGGDGLP